MTRHVLSLATLYPNAANPRFGTFVAGSLEALAARGDWRVTVINPIGQPPLALGRYAALRRAAVDGIENGVTVHRPRFPLVPGLSGRWNPALIARVVLPLAGRFHAKAPFDLVDAQFFYPDGPAAALVAKALGLPLSIKARGADIHFWGSKPASRRQMLDAAERAAGLLTVSEALKGDMVAMGMQADNIALHYTGLDRGRFKPSDRVGARAALNLPRAGTLLATVGALIPRKGQEFVLRALALLPGADLALAGQGPDEVKLRALADDLGVADRVHWLGSLDHDALPRLLAAADVMVLPASSEGLANAWIEALACGTPIVIADAGGAREVVSSPAAGRIVARDAKAIAAAVSEILGDPPMPEAVAATVQRFSWEANAAALAEYYEGLLT